MGVIVRDERPDRSAQMSLAQRNVMQAFLLDRTNRSVERPRSKPRFNERAAKPRVPPRGIFASHRQQLPHPSSGERGRPAAGRSRLPSYLAATFSRYQRKIVSGVASDATSASRFRPSGPAPFGEETTLRVREAQTRWAEAASKHSVLHPQVLDRFALPANQPACNEEDNQELKWCQQPHGCPILDAPPSNENP
jgi:hypothetical protein